MEYTIMIVCKPRYGNDGGVTSQIKSFPTKALADRIAAIVENTHPELQVTVIKLYIDAE